MASKDSEQKNKIYNCTKCGYSTRHLGHWKRHIETNKHQRMIRPYVCMCGKSYKHNSSYYHHLKTCKSNDSEKYTKDMVIKLLEEENDLQKQIIEMSPQTNITNNINNNFNLNVFLNEECKDAINMSEFIKSINIQLQDIEHTKNNGICLGLQNIFVNALKSLGTNKRPIHCTDAKRETLYIKEEDIWCGENDKNREQIKKSLSNIADKQCKEIKQWEEVNIKDESDKGNDEYQKMVSNIFSTLDDTQANRVIKEIAKEVKIDKEVKM